MSKGGVSFLNVLEQQVRCQPLRGAKGPRESEGARRVQKGLDDDIREKECLGCMITEELDGGMMCVGGHGDKT